MEQSWRLETTKIETSSVRGLVDAPLDPVPEPAVELL